MAGVTALATAAGGAVGNHLPWPSLLEQHPLWTAAAFFAISATTAVVATALFARDDPGNEKARSARTVATAPPAPVAVAVDGNVTAGSGRGAGSPAGRILVLPSAIEAAKPLPPPRVDLCLGRDGEVAAVVAAWTAGRSVAVVGGPGIGKSTVLGRAIADDAVIAAYGRSRRFVVSCDGAESAQAAVDKMAQALGVPLATTYGIGCCRSCAMRPACWYSTTSRPSPTPT